MTLISMVQTRFKYSDTNVLINPNIKQITRLAKNIEIDNEEA
jgi:hypothetical protein